MANSFDNQASRMVEFSEMFQEYLGERIDPHSPIPGSKFATDGSLLCQVGPACQLPVYIQQVKLEVGGSARAMATNSCRCNVSSRHPCVLPPYPPCCMPAYPNRHVTAHATLRHTQQWHTPMPSLANPTLRPHRHPADWHSG